MVKSKHIKDFNKEIDKLTARNNGKPLEVEGPNGVFMTLTKENWQKFQNRLDKKLGIK